ncbi:hypothetical protein WJX84_004238 [Apatococcus fuscideae]|uniref:RING-type domain-containing protein n=1 Tax=Apatococcus fuscideae TaxID=2026836 RepID=A0AAW1TCV8_9CHLO
MKQQGSECPLLTLSAALQWRFHFDALFAKAQGDSTGSHFSPAFMLDGLHWKIWLKFPTDMKYNSDSVLAAYLYCTNEEFDEANYAISVQMRHPSEPSDSINREGTHLFTTEEPATGWPSFALISALRDPIDSSQMQIELWLNTLSACQHDSEYSQELSDSCVKDCIRRPGGACLFQNQFIYNSITFTGLVALLVTLRNYFLITKRGAMFASYLLLHRGVYLWFNMAGYQDMLSWLLALVVAVAALKDCVTAATTSSAVEEYADPMSQLELQLDIDTLLPCIMDVFLALTFFTSWKHAVLDTVFLPTRNWDTRMKLEHLDKHRQLRLHWHGHMFKRAAPSFCVALSGAAAWLTLRLLALLGSAHAKAVLSEQSAQADQGRHESWSWRSVMSLVVRTAKFWSWALFIHMTAPVWDPLSHLGRCLSSSSLQFRHAYLRARQPSSAPRRARTAHRQQARRPHAGLQQWTAQSWQAVVEGVYTACTAAMTLLWTAILWPFKQHRASSASNAAAHRSQPGITAKTSGQPSSRQQRRGGSKAKAKARPKPSQKADNAIIFIPCGHVLHCRRCNDLWAARSSGLVTCPLCRSKVLRIGSVEVESRSSSAYQ